VKASLVSATSVIALLAMESGSANAALTITLANSTMTVFSLIGHGATAFTDIATVTSGNNTTLTFGAVSLPGIAAGFSGAAQSFPISGGSASSVTGTYSYNATVTGASGSTTVTVTDAGATPVTLTMKGAGVAPIANVLVTNSNTANGGTANTGSVGNVLVNNAVNAVVTVSNSGNGNLSGLGTISNLLGSIGSASNSVFVGTGGSVSLGDTSSATFTYAFTPTARGSTTATVVTTFTDGGTNNAARTITTSLAGTGVAPVLNLSATVSAGYVLVGSGNTGTASVVVQNTGDGNKSGIVTTSNLRGTVGTAAASGFSGSGGAVSATDTSSVTFNYVYTPTVRGTSTTNVVSTFVNGSTDGTNQSVTGTTTLTGTGVAPVASVTAGTTYVRLGTSGTATATLSNVGNGNLSGAGTISNLRGSATTTVGTNFAAMAGNPGTISLADAASTTLGYTYTPVSRTAQTSTATFSLLDGNIAGTNTAQTLTATVTAQGVGPTYRSTFGSTVNTPTAVAHDATATTGPTLNFGTAGVGYAQTFYLDLANITTDSNGGNTALTDLSINHFTIAGANAGNFSSAFTPGTVIHEGGSILMPITVMAANAGLLTGTLTVFTDEATALGGIGDTFTYQLAVLAPEPASLAVLGAGLAGLAGIRRRRRGH
jgi:hypothetical protein